MSLSTLVGLSQGMSHMTDFGRVGHIKGGMAGMNDCDFMVIGPSGNEYIRAGKPDYRVVVVLSGVGFISGPILPGEHGAINLDDADIEWLE